MKGSEALLHILRLRKMTVVCLAAVLFSAAVRCPAASITAIDDNRGDYPGSQVPRYEKFEITMSLAGDPYSNPFDPAVIDIEAHFVNPVTSEEMVTWGFWYQGYDRSYSGGEVLTASGSPKWKIRFTPTEAGVWNYYVTADDGGTSARYPASGYASFTAAASANKGFLRVADNNDYLEYDDGTSFLGIGPDVCWPSPEADETYSYDYYLGEFANHGCTFTRVWIMNALMGRDEWIWTIQDTALGADYDLADAWRADYLLELAKEKGVQIMWCIEGCPGEFETAKWSRILYNTANGGPCADIFDFITNETAKAYFRQVLRYLVARYSYSCNLGVWEFWNEVHEMEWQTAKYDKLILCGWHAEMGQYLDSIDPYGRLVSTSMGSYDAYPQLWSLPEMDVSQMHSYANTSFPDGRDMALLIPYRSRGIVHGAGGYGKPQFFSEFGLDSSSRAGLDTAGVHIHNGIWAGLMCKLAVLPQTWWWEDFRSRSVWWDHYLALANFTEGIEFNKGHFLRQRFEDCSADSRLRTLGMVNGRQRLLWIQNKENTWYRVVIDHLTPSTVAAGTQVTIPDVPIGEYDVEWWDTYAGTVITTQTVSNSSEGLTLSLPVAVNKDIAVKINGGPQADIDNDGKVTFDSDYGIFAGYWLEDQCGGGGCEGSDFDADGDVDERDLKTLAELWLQGSIIQGTVPKEITYDSAASGAVSGGVSLVWTHTVGEGENVILVVGLAAEDGSSGDMTVSSVTCNGVTMTAADGSAVTVSSGGETTKTELFYILSPARGANQIAVTYAGDVDYKTGGSITLFNVKQQGPEVVVANSVLGDYISTSITTLSDESWLVDLLGCGNSGTFTDDYSEYDKVWEEPLGGEMTGAGAVRPLDFPQEYKNLAWKHSNGNRIGHSVIAIAPAEGGVY